MAEITFSPPLDAAMLEHGRTCQKAAHSGSGYLHAEDDDRPYDVDGVRYCGRCHFALGAVVSLPPVRVQGFDRLFTRLEAVLGRRDV